MLVITLVPQTLAIIDALGTIPWDQGRTFLALSELPVLVCANLHSCPREQYPRVKSLRASIAGALGDVDLGLLGASPLGLGVRLLS